MKGPEIVAALKGIINTTTLCALSPEDKQSSAGSYRPLICVFALLLTTGMPLPEFTRYRLVVTDLKDLAADINDIAQDTEENISEVEAVLAQHYLKQILEGLILATRIGRRTWPSLSLQMQSLTTSASPTGTSTDYLSTQTSDA